ncbi:MAG: phosphoserine phosphatase SerB [Candidatus Parcubacteria bacterium]|jgi:phosphoserine phosphatase
MKTIIFDVDDTLTTSGSWERLNAAAGITADEDFALYSGFMQGDYDYHTWTKQLEDLYRERHLLTRDIATKTLLDFELRTGVLETTQTLKAHGHVILLISGGFREMVEAVGSMTQADAVFATSDIAFDDAGYFHHFISSGEEGEAKANILRDYCKKRNIDLTDCVAIGDSTNDITLFQLTGNGVTFSWCKPEVQAAARHIIDDIRDFPALLDIL